MIDFNAIKKLINNVNSEPHFVIMDISESKELYIEYEVGVSVHFNKRKQIWEESGWALMDARFGYNGEYSLGFKLWNEECMHKITPITKEEAEQITGSSIDLTKIKSEIYGNID